MKKLTTLTILALLGTGLHAQVVPSTAPVISSNNVSRLISFAQSAETAKTITIAAYPGYAPDLRVNGVKKSYGFGLALMYPIAPETLDSHVFTGVRFDYIGGDFFMPSVDLGLKADVQILGHNFTPFTMGGAIYPLNGAGDQNSSLGAIVGAGITTTVWQSADQKKSLNVFFATEKWTLFDGVIYRPGVAFNWSF